MRLEAKKVRAFTTISSLALLATLPSIALAQKIGDRRIVERPDAFDCQVYRNEPIDFQGNKRLMWVSVILTHSDFVRACANAINLKQYLASRPVQTLDAVDHIVSAINEGRGRMIQKAGRGIAFTHACGTDGLVYDVYSDGSTRLHPQTLRYPSKRCRISQRPRQYRGGVADVIPTNAGE
jgi:hypothetical protein